jgi:ABC-type metal ion transport system, periplasmic component/surface adhesin
MNLRRATVPAIAAVATLALASCGSGGAAGSDPAATSGKVPVVASTNVYGSIVSAVGGDAVEVRSIIDGPSADPHEYESTPADAASFNRAKVVVHNGAGYDDFAGKLLEAAATKPAAIDVTEMSGLIPPGGGEFNEHVWYSLPTVKKLADRIASDLGAADPAAAATFTANAASFNAKIDALMGRIEAIRTKHAGDKVAITEPVPVYLVEAAGLVDATPVAFSAAVEEGTDPPAAVLADTLAVFQGSDAVHAVLTNAQTEGAATRQVEQVATAAGVPVVTVTETLPAGVTDYVTWMTGQVDALAAALDRTA